jgi:hypothetical protein
MGMLYLSLLCYDSIIYKLFYQSKHNYILITGFDMSKYSSVLADTNFVYCKIILEKLLERFCETLNLILYVFFDRYAPKLNSPSNFEFKL